MLSYDLAPPPPPPLPPVNKSQIIRQRERLALNNSFNTLWLISIDQKKLDLNEDQKPCLVLQFRGLLSHLFGVDSERFCGDGLMFVNPELLVRQHEDQKPCLFLQFRGLLSHLFGVDSERFCGDGLMFVNPELLVWRHEQSPLRHSAVVVVMLSAALLSRSEHYINMLTLRR